MSVISQTSSELASHDAVEQNMDSNITVRAQVHRGDGAGIAYEGWLNVCSYRYLVSVAVLLSWMMNIWFDGTLDCKQCYLLLH